MRNDNFSNYFNYSKDFLSSILFLTPFVVLYELLCYFLFNNKDYVIRNSADAFIRSNFDIISNNFQFYYPLILITLIIIYVLYNYEKYDNFHFSLDYYFIMVIEGFIYSIVLLIIINGFGVFDDDIIYNYNTYLLNFYSSLGAGVWEEVFFRLFMYNVIYYVANKIFNNKKTAIITAIIISSLLFSMFHYYGNQADIFFLNTFIIRFVAGVLLCLIYIKRGLGITCFTHLVYDVLLFSIPLL